MLTRPEIMTTMTECGALWHIVMQYMFAIGQYISKQLVVSIIKQVSGRRQIVIAVM